MKRLNIRSLTTLVLFGIIFVAFGPASSARAADNIVFVNPTNNATVNVGSGSSPMLVKFKMNNGFLPVLATLTLDGGTPTSQNMFTYDGLLLEWTVSYTMGTAGNYPNSTVKIDATKPGDSSGNKAVDDTLTVTGITVIKQQ